ncbi:MAG TPA: FtsX-like permease family protein, partial [Solirubrobacterales bacterium]|nr:FtsX-like permease family protein [Solirubrobacterales bacterium]
MRSFGSLALRQVRARRLRSLLTAAGIVLGVAMILGVLLLAVTIHRTFTDLFDSVYGRTDLVISGTGGDSLRHSTLETVRRTPDVAKAEGIVIGVFTLVDRSGAASADASARLNVAGERAAAARLAASRTVAGRQPRRGRKISLQKSWADAHDIGLGDRVRLATPAGTRSLRVVGLFQFTTGLDFGGQGFGRMPIATARRLMDKSRAFDEVDVVVSGGEESISRTRHALSRRLPRGVKVQTPQSKSADVEQQLQAFNVILYFFAAMALFVGGFLIFNSFHMTVFQRTREIGMLRTLGAGRWAITGSVLREAAVLGLLGAALGLGLGVALAIGLIELMRALGFPVGDLAFSSLAPIAAVATGLVTAVLGALHPARRAGRTPPIRAVLGTEGLRDRPRPRRAAIGAILIALGLGGAFWLGAANETTTIVAAAGMLGTIAIFVGIALVSPFVIRPLVRG